MKIFIRFLLSVFLLGMPSCASSAPVQVSIIGRVCTLQAGECAAEYLKKAYAGLVYDSAKVIVENNNTRYEQADPKLFWDGLWWSFLAGVLLMLSSIGLFIYIFMLGLMHLFRFKELFLMLTAGISFVAGFTLFFAVCRYYTFQIMQLFDLFSVQLFFSIGVIAVVGWFSMLLLGLFYDHTHPQHFRTGVGLVRTVVQFLGFGALAALCMFSQKNASFLLFARQLDLTQLSGSVVLFSLFMALGAGSMVFLYWIISAYFLKEERVGLWFFDVVSLLSWASVYLLIEVVKPFILPWHGALLSIVVLIFAGSYLWNSARAESAYHFFNEYSRNDPEWTFNHMIAGFRGLKIRVVCKRLWAIIAFTLIVPTIGKLYLNYHRLTVRQIFFRAIRPF